MKLLETIDVWRRMPSGTCIRYRCFRIHPSGCYCVQSADHYSSKDPSRASQMERQFLELLSEQAPDDRSGSFSSLEEAIEDFDVEFGNMLDER
jgi:hypothetical protein